MLFWPCHHLKESDGEARPNPVDSYDQQRFTLASQNTPNSGLMASYEHFTNWISVTTHNEDLIWDGFGPEYFEYAPETLCEVIIDLADISITIHDVPLSSEQATQLLCSFSLVINVLIAIAMNDFDHHQRYLIWLLKEFVTQKTTSQDTPTVWFHSQTFFFSLSHTYMLMKEGGFW